jgi:hypothetical protein
LVHLASGTGAISAGPRDAVLAWAMIGDRDPTDWECDFGLQCEKKVRM